MLRMLSQAANARRSVTRENTISGRTTPYDTPYTDDESFSSFSESENERPRRRKAVGGKAAKSNSKVKSSCNKTKLGGSGKAKEKAGVNVVDKKPVNKKKEKTQPPPEDLVHIAKKEGSTKFQQMRKFLERTNEADKPTDILSGFLNKRGRSSASSPLKPLVLLPGNSEGSPVSGRSSLAMSPRIAEFHTGLTPTNRSSSPSTYQFFPAPGRRDSDDGFAASDLFAGNGETATNKIGSFIHGQRGLNLRRKMNSKQNLVAGATDSTTALLMEEIPDMESRLQETAKQELERRILVNSAENEDEENMVHETSILHDDLNASMGM